jgi:hypothetical protein
MRTQSAILVALGAASTLVGACMWRAPTQRHVDMVVPRPDTGVAPAASILAARFSRDDSRTPAAADAIVLVFDRDVDAVSLVPQAFLIVEDDGTRVFALQAVLAPASESDENRSVTLYGDFGDPKENPATDVIVVGPVYAEDGTPLLGASAKIEPWDIGTRAVVAESIPPGPLRCPDARQVLRTYWSDEIRGVDPADLARVQIGLGQGPARAPVGFDDHAGESDPSDDNVLDLCVDVDVPIVELRIAPGTFVDATGQPSAAVALPVRDGPPR